MKHQGCKHWVLVESFSACHALAVSSITPQSLLATSLQEMLAACTLQRHLCMQPYLI